MRRKAPIVVPEQAIYRLAWEDAPGTPVEMMRDFHVDGVQLLIGESLPATDIARRVRKALARTDPRLRRRLRKLIFPAARVGHAARRPDVLATASWPGTIIAWGAWRDVLARAVFNHELAHLASGPDLLPGQPWRERWEQARQADRRHAAINLGAELTARINATATCIGPLTRTLHPGGDWITCYASEQDTDRARLSEDFAEAMGLYLHGRSRLGDTGLITFGWRTYRFTDLFPFRAAVIEQMLRARPTWKFKLRWRARTFDLGPLHVRPVCLVRDGEQALNGSWRVWNRRNGHLRYLGAPLAQSPREVPWPSLTQAQLRELRPLVRAGRVPLAAAQAVLAA